MLLSLRIGTYYFKFSRSNKCHFNNKKHIARFFPCRPVSILHLFCCHQSSKARVRVVDVAQVCGGKNFFAIAIAAITQGINNQGTIRQLWFLNEKRKRSSCKRGRSPFLLLSASRIFCMHDAIAYLYFTRAGMSELEKIIGFEDNRHLIQAAGGARLQNCRKTEIEALKIVTNYCCPPQHILLRD